MTSKKAIDEDLIVLNVSGLRYQLEKRILHKFPGALLDSVLSAYNVDGELNESNEKSDDEDHLSDFHWTSDKHKRNDYVFVQRSPQMFEMIVLQTYVTGRLHVPKWMCPHSVMEELKFWRLNVDHACSCCTDEEPNEHDAGANEKDGLHEQQSHVGEWEKFRRRAWNLVDKPSASVAATIFSIISLTFVFLSCAVFVAGSFKIKQYCVNDTGIAVIADENGNLTKIFGNSYTTTAAFYSNSTLSNKNGTTDDDGVSSDNENFDSTDSSTFFSNCQVTQILNILEMTCIIWFTLELAVRLLFCPNVLKFFRHPLNIIDILATVPYYIEIALAYLEYHSPQVKRLHGIFVLIRVLRCFRVFRILKLARYFEELRILGKTLKAAKDELCMLGLFVFIAVFIFSSVMYQLEKDEAETQYTSIPASCWWGIVTLTTVGYGDMFPKTIYGKVLASVACVAGIIITAFPVSILVEHFTAAYKSKSRPMFQIRREKIAINDFIKTKGASKTVDKKRLSI